MVAVHDHPAQHNPAVLQRLKRLFHRDLVTPGTSTRRAAIRANCFPVFSEASDGPTLRCMRYRVERGHERVGKPLQPRDLEAFDALDAVLNDPEFRHDFTMVLGDLLFIDNHKVAHDREAYQDNSVAPRLMVRLGLNAPQQPQDPSNPR